MCTTVISMHVNRSKIPEYIKQIVTKMDAERCNGIVMQETLVMQETTVPQET